MVLRHRCGDRVHDSRLFDLVGPVDPSSLVTELHTGCGVADRSASPLFPLSALNGFSAVCDDSAVHPGKWLVGGMRVLTGGTTSESDSGCCSSGSPSFCWGYPSGFSDGEADSYDRMTGLLVGRLVRVPQEVEFEFRASGWPLPAFPCSTTRPFT